MRICPRLVVESDKIEVDGADPVQDNQNSPKVQSHNDPGPCWKILPHSHLIVLVKELF